MLRLRVYLLLLLVFTGITLNIERLDFGPKEDVINLASFVYLLFGAAVISTILMPRKWKLSTRTITIFWVAVYTILKFTIGDDRPVIGGLYTYITIAEIFALVVLVILTRMVMENLLGLEETVANITLADVSNRVIDMDSATPSINMEFARSRRYNRPIGVVVIKLTPENVQANIDELSKDILRTMMSRYSMSNLIRAIDKEVRRPDLILEQHKENRIVLLLPESDIEATRAVSGNIQEVARTRIGSTVAIGTAAFPEDAITFEDLVLYAESAIDASQDAELEEYVHADQDVELTNLAPSK